MSDPIQTSTEMQSADGTRKPGPPPYQARGGATSFNQSTYTVGQASYPEDLLANPQYGGNYVVFYINVHEDSMLVNGSGAAPTVDARFANPRLSGELKGQDISGTTLDVALGATAGTAVYAAGIGSKVTGTVAGASSTLGATPKQAIVSSVGKALDVGLGVGAAAVAAKTLGGAKKEYKQLKQTIALHLPSDLAIRYGMQWEESDLAGTTAILAVAENFGSSIKDAIFAPSGQSQAGEKMMAAGSALANYGTSQALRLPGIGEAISKTSGMAANPKKEQLFKQVDFRTFSYTYQFFPKSPSEARNVQEIIKLFKLHMHPEFKKDSYNFMYIYPSEFDIYYYHQGKENLNLHRHTSCVLTDMSVMYTPTGTASMLPGGMPSQINVTLTFKELAILTKENIQDGF